MSIKIKYSLTIIVVFFLLVTVFAKNIAAFASPNVAHAIVQSQNCLIGSWHAMSSTNAPAKRSGATSVWTGSEVIIWGGKGVDNNYQNGGRYNPATDDWNSISMVGAPDPRKGHTALWTGSEMIVWGGVNDALNTLNTGGRYNPATDTWRAISTTNAPEQRMFHTAIWTGTEMIVWGGLFSENFADHELDDGGRYNPVTDTWTSLSTLNAPIKRTSHTAVWTGTEMIVWGGETSYIYGALNSGGRYNPATNTWTSVATVGAPMRRTGHIAVWTGNEMIIWGGYYQETSSPAVFMIEGGRYNPLTNSWTLFSINDGPQGRVDPAAVWTGRELLMWGGTNLVEFSQIGGRYLPGTNQWVLTQPDGAPVGRTGHTAVWTGSEMVIWGGEKYSLIEAGGRYRLENDPGCFYVNIPLVAK